MMRGPEDLQGHWHRAWLKAPGISDHETSVHWMQAGTLYADIRIPARRPDVRGAGALADLSDGTLLTLLKAEGFAGSITVEGDVCTWARHINWHGQPDGVDAGHMRFESANRLVETGVHADYAELWNRRIDEPVHALHLTAGTRHAYLLTVGKRFVFGIGDPGVSSSAAALTALQAGQRSRALHDQFIHIYAMGRWVGNSAMADICTNPLLEGMAVLTCSVQGDLTWHSEDFLGHRQDVTLNVVARAQHDAA